jgi:hypothetical protein
MFKFTESEANDIVCTPENGRIQPRILCWLKNDELIRRK